MRQIRRWLSRSEWSLRLLRLPNATVDHKRGVVLLQIDGLAKSQLEKAIKRGRMPFLHKLLKREGYRLHDVYSGIPSTTAAAQAELFYGVKGAVPAFAYKERENGRFMKLILPECASRMEDHLGGLGEGLTKGGSSYSNMFSGGAEEIHFCASGMGVADILKNANPLGILAVLIWNFHSILRLGGMMVLEVIVALYDSIRGAIARGEVRQELLFVLSRVFVVVGLRELITVQASMDVARGLPIVHVNFVGYDEQAHRRGPSSKFAHFSLLGIDNCIERVWRAAHRSFRRDYDVWIYSDHGQETTMPYAKENHRPLEDAISEVFGAPTASPSATRRAPRMLRSQQHSVNRLEGYLLRRAGSSIPTEIPVEPGSPVVIAVGPYGHIYLSEPPEPGQRDGIARRLVDKANIPMVMFPDGPDKARVVTPEGQFELPRDSSRVLGPMHPFPEECGRDLVRSCHHPHSGDFVIAGWRPRGRPISFVWEHGGHGGPGYEETHAFGLFPVNAPLPQHGTYLRYSHIREAAMHVRGTPSSVMAYPRRLREAEKTLRVMTYNIHGCGGMDGKVSTARIARVIAHYEPDIIALQECYGSKRGDQARAIATELKEVYHFPAALNMLQDDYGNAIMSVHSLRLVKAGKLPTLPDRSIEVRGAMWALVDFHGAEIHFMNTHLGLFSLERQRQAEALIGAEWLGSESCGNPVILSGDFNAFPSSTVYRTLTGRLHEAQENAEGHRSRNTFPGRYPVSRIDHIFCSSEFKTLKVEVPRTHLTRLASDHLPLVAEISLPTAEAKRPGEAAVVSIRN
ncbi:MAG: endonuclease/exonuclease/phosphatase family protein [Fibrobacterota bacterium]|nr:endonuclease/exonuclease/phosphatase family protein [Fibrobacterota bacterium]